ncbi:hybrid sensor histidine kinase/response regulator [Vibrio mexicanus]|uniref:hybrid sensor histidine kinase/response regulator n=1 Tax=Vibrio mexicanus TaxID=1004326 RepID=UPI001EE2EEA3|nr:hybrid sensor histidine kinase/response regulator [Vibrio mexicanus]
MIYCITSVGLCAIVYTGVLSLFYLPFVNYHEVVPTLLACAFIGLSWRRIFDYVSSYTALLVYGQTSSPVSQILSIEKDFKSSIDLGKKNLAKQLNIPYEQLEIVTNTDHRAFYQDYIDSNKTVLIAEEVEDQLPSQESPTSSPLHNLYQTMKSSQIGLVLPLFDQNESFTHVLISSHKLDNSLFTIEEISALQKLLKRIQNLIDADRKVKQSQALANSIAHEMRNPLAQVQLQLEHLAELVRNKSDTSLMQEYLEAGDLAVLRGRQLIDIILREVNDSSLEQEAASPSSIRVAIEQALNRYGFESNSIRDRVKLNDGEDFVANINDTLFNFVIFNLLRNAIYYFDSYPESQIEISTLTDTHENQVIFRDTGPGIDSRYVQRVFDDFYSHQKSGGSGLGLGYCRRVMESFGGRIECRSELGQYTEFIMHFPVQSVRLDEVKQSSNGPIFKASNNQKSSVRYPNKPSKTLAGKTVLVVDDKEIQRALVTLYLSQLGMHTIQANDGESAVSICKSNPIDLILMDIQMPRMNGFEATALIKKITPTTPIIALSGESSPADIEKMAMLMDGRLEKPTTKNALAELMKVKLELPVS